MDLPTPPIVCVRRIETHDKMLYEYLIIQGDKQVNFFLDRAAHESLQIAQRQSDQGLESQKPEAAPFHLKLIGAD